MIRTAGSRALEVASNHRKSKSSFRSWDPVNKRFSSPTKSKSKTGGSRRSSTRKIKGATVTWDPVSRSFIERPPQAISRSEISHRSRRSSSDVPRRSSHKSDSNCILYSILAAFAAVILLLLLLYVCFWMNPKEDKSQSQSPTEPSDANGKNHEPKVPRPKRKRDSEDPVQESDKKPPRTHDDSDDKPSTRSEESSCLLTDWSFELGCLAVLGVMTWFLPRMTGGVDHHEDTTDKCEIEGALDNCQCPTDEVAVDKVCVPSVDSTKVPMSELLKDITSCKLKETEREAGNSSYTYYCGPPDAPEKHMVKLTNQQVTEDELPSMLQTDKTMCKLTRTKENLDQAGKYSDRQDYLTRAYKCGNTSVLHYNTLGPDNKKTNW